MNFSATEQTAIKSTASSTFNSVKELSPLTILQNGIRLWAPLDARLESNYMADNEVYLRCTPVERLIAEDMELSITKKIPKENSVLVGVFLPANISEILRHEQEEQEHLSLWERNGSPNIVFDPKTADIYSVPLPGASEPPSPKKALYVCLRVSLDIRENDMVLCYSAQDLKDRVLYYNTLESKDISYLFRRMMHELFGNLEVMGNSGPFLEGISHLIQGKKVSACLEHPKPFWFSGKEQYKTSNPEAELLKQKAHLYSWSANILTYLVPQILLVWGIIINTINALATFSTKTGGDPYYLHKLVITVVLIVLSFKFAQYLKNRSVVLTIKSKYL